MRRWLAVLLVTGTAAGVTVAAARRPHELAAPPVAPSPTPETDPLPAPGAALPRDPDRLAATLTAMTRRLHEAVQRWDPARAAPRDVTYLALHHQPMLRLMSDRRQLGDAVLQRLPADVRGEARDTVSGRRHLAAIPRAPFPRALVRPRVDQLRRVGVRPHPQRQRGRRARPDAVPYRALFAYNHSTSYVRAIRSFAKRMRTDDRAFLAYYAWQVYLRTPHGTRRLTGPVMSRR